MSRGPSPEHIANRLKSSLEDWRTIDTIEANARIDSYRELFKAYSPISNTNPELVTAASAIAKRLSVMSGRAVEFMGSIDHIDKTGDRCRHVVDQPSLAYIGDAIATSHPDFFGNTEDGHIVYLSIAGIIDKDWGAAWLSVGETLSLRLLSNEAIIGNNIINLLRRDAAERNSR